MTVKNRDVAKKMESIGNYLKEIRQSVDFISTEVLEPLPYENHSKSTRVTISHPEFTSLCPKTGLPDAGTITIDYLPDNYIVELKSLKFYFLQFRNAGVFYEHLSRLILDHLVEVLKPFDMTVTADFTPRGGLSSKVVSTYSR